MILSEEEKAYCLECGEELAYGRPDRKFCCHSCKNKYHNRKHVQRRNYKRRIEHTLEKNYQILTHLISSGLSSVPFTNLWIMGFNPLYSTSSFKQGHHNLRMCFDISYLMTDNKIYDIKYIDELPEQYGK